MDYLEQPFHKGGLVNWGDWENPCEVVNTQSDSFKYGIEYVVHDLGAAMYASQFRREMSKRTESQGHPNIDSEGIMTTKVGGYPYITRGNLEMYESKGQRAVPRISKDRAVLMERVGYHALTRLPIFKTTKSIQLTPTAKSFIDKFDNGAFPKITKGDDFPWKQAAYKMSTKENWEVWTEA